ncbi:MAG: cytochrome c [Isosphaeraceae bacterium]|nr:cytochrome c [Isosphaeraceae bacterium]
MQRKFVALFVAMPAVALLMTGLALAAEPAHGPLEEIMEKVQKNTNNIRKATRTLPAWKKDQASVAKDATELKELGEKTKKVTDYAKELKKPVAEWEKLSDDLIKTAGELATLASKKDATQPQAKEAFNAINKSCTACHSVFRVEE